MSWNNREGNRLTVPKELRKNCKRVALGKKKGAQKKSCDWVDKRVVSPSRIKEWERFLEKVSDCYSEQKIVLH